VAYLADSDSDGDYSIVVRNAATMSSDPWGFPGNGDMAAPSIWGDVVAYAADPDDNGVFDIYYRDSSDEYNQLRVNPSAKGNPDVWRNVVAWEEVDPPGPDTEIVVDVLDSPLGPLFISTDPADSSDPAVWGEWVAWLDDSAPDNKILAENLITGERVEIDQPGKSEAGPSVFGDQLCYLASDAGLTNPQLYVYDLVSGDSKQPWTAPSLALPGDTSIFGQHVGSWISFVFEADMFVSELQRTVDIEQLEGPTRYDTAAEISKAAFPDPATVNTCIVATGRNFPDALGGSALAGVAGAPILLTQPTDLPEVTETELQRLGPTTVYILGGTGAVSADVQVAIQAAVPGATITRLEGSNRYGTARAVAEQVALYTGLFPNYGGIVATGANFPDALAASPVAAAQGMPIYLAESSGIATETVTQMTTDGVQKVYVVGGADVVSDETYSALTDEFGVANVTRIAGPDRYATAREIGKWAVEDLPFMEWEGVTMATGRNFPDALTGGVLSARRGTVLLLTHPTALTPTTEDVLTEYVDKTYRLTFFGGMGAVSDDVIAAAKDAVE